VKIAARSKPKLEGNVQVLLKDICKQKAKTSINLSVLSRNLKNLKVLQSPLDKKVTKKMYNRNFNIMKVKASFNVVNPKLSSFLHISDEGMNYGVPSAIETPPQVSKPKIKRNLRELRYNDYVDSHHPNMRSFKSMHHSQENLNLKPSMKSRLRLSTESLQEKTICMNSSFAPITGSNSFEVRRGSQTRLQKYATTPLRVNQKQIRHQIKKKLNQLKGKTLKMYD